MSWFDRLISFLRSLPGPTWISGFLIAGTMWLLFQGIIAISRGGAPENFSLGLIVAASWSPLMATAFSYIKDITVQSLRKFRPISALDDTAYKNVSARLTEQSATEGWIALIISAVFMVPLRLSDPTILGLAIGMQPADTFVLALGWLNTSVVMMSIMRAWRILTTIEYLYSTDQQVNLFNRGPLFAFSRVASAFALNFVVMTYYFFYIGFPKETQNPLMVGVTLLLGLPFTLAILIAPLYSMHIRMAEEKERLEAEVRTRIEQVVADLHRAMDSGQQAGLDPLNRLLSSLMTEEEYLRKIPTWPWEPGTPIRLISIVLVPPIIFIVQQLLLRFLPR